MNKRFGKNDIILLAVLLIAGVGLLLFYYLGFGQAGDYAVVTVDGASFGRYALVQDQEIPIENAEGVFTNLLVIQNGKAKMKEADCPDHLCMHQKAISHDGETIVCLPNRIVVSVEAASDDSDLDVFVR